MTKQEAQNNLDNVLREVRRNGEKRAYVRSTIETYQRMVETLKRRLEKLAFEEIELVKKVKEARTELDKFE